MTMPLYPECRLIIEPTPLSGAENMARDEVLLDEGINANAPVVRMYQWERPTLSLGYFQERASWMDAPAWDKTEKVRRLTGGGAILHDQEWTYSCVIPSRNFRLHHPYDLYDRIHDAIVVYAESYGIPLRPRGENLSRVSEPYLCYLRGDSHDLCLESSKIVGSAQRRRKAALLQHGSFLLRRSPLAFTILGVQDLLPNVQLPQEMESLGLCLAEVLGEHVVRSDWTQEEYLQANELAMQKYNRLEWD